MCKYLLASLPRERGLYALGYSPSEANAQRGPRSALAIGYHSDRTTACVTGRYAAQGAGCSPMGHAFTQFPYAVLGAVLALVIFLILGHTM